MKSVRLSLRWRWTLWVAALTSVAGLVVLAITVSLTAKLLHDRAPRPPRPAVVALNPPPRPGQAQPPRTVPGELPPGQPAAATETGRALADQTLRDVRQVGGLTLAGVVLASIVIAWIVAGRMLQPLARVTTAARQISGASDGQRLNYVGPRDELHELADTFDAMLDRVDATFDQQNAFVANAAHELRTPLALMRSEIDVALDGGDGDEQRVALHELRGNVDRMSALSERLLHLSRAGTMLSVESHDLAYSAQMAVRSSARLDGATIQPVLALASAPVKGDAVLLDQLAVNLVENAVAYGSPTGLLLIETGSESRWSRLIVENDGAYVDPAVVEELFDRFRRRTAVRRTAGSGFGLGLTIVSAIVRTHGGTLHAASRPAGGLRVEVRLPHPT